MVSLFPHVVVVPADEHVLLGEHGVGAGEHGEYVGGGIALHVEGVDQLHRPIGNSERLGLAGGVHLLLQRLPVPAGVERPQELLRGQGGEAQRLVVALDRGWPRGRLGSSLASLRSSSVGIVQRDSELDGLAVASWFAGSSTTIGPSAPRAAASRAPSAAARRAASSPAPRRSLLRPAVLVGLVAEDHHDLAAHPSGRPGVVVPAELLGHDAVAREHHRGLGRPHLREAEGEPVGAHGEGPGRGGAGDGVLDGQLRLRCRVRRTRSKAAGSLPSIPAPGRRPGRRWTGSRRPPRGRVSPIRDLRGAARPGSGRWAGCAPPGSSRTPDAMSGGRSPCEASSASTTAGRRRPSIEPPPSRREAAGVYRQASGSASPTSPYRSRGTPWRRSRSRSPPTSPGRPPSSSCTVRERRAWGRTSATTRGPHDAVAAAGPVQPLAGGYTLASFSMHLEQLALFPARRRGGGARLPAAGPTRAPRSTWRSDRLAARFPRCSGARYTRSASWAPCGAPSRTGSRCIRDALQARRPRGLDRGAGGRARGHGRGRRRRPQGHYRGHPWISARIPRSTGGSPRGSRTPSSRTRGSTRAHARSVPAPRPAHLGRAHPLGGGRPGPPVPAALAELQAVALRNARPPARLLRALRGARDPALRRRAVRAGAGALPDPAPGRPVPPRRSERRRARRVQHGWAQAGLTRRKPARGATDDRSGHHRIHRARSRRAAAAAAATRSFARSIRSPAGSSTIPRRSGLGDAALAQALAEASIRATIAAIGITNQRETAVIWDRRPASRAQRDRVAGPAHRRALRRAQAARASESAASRAHRPHDRSVLLGHEGRAGCSTTSGMRARARAGARVRHDRLVPAVAADRRRRPRDRRQQRIAHAAVRYRTSSPGATSCSSCSACRARCCRRSCRRRVVSARHAAFPGCPTASRSRASPAISRRRCSVRRASRPATRSARTAPARSS